MFSFAGVIVAMAAGLRRTDIIGLKLVSPVESSLARLYPVHSGPRHASQVRSSWFYTKPVQSGYNGVSQSGFDFTKSIKSDLYQSKPNPSGLEHSNPVQSGLGLTPSDSCGLRDSRSRIRTVLRSPEVNGAKRPVKRSSANDTSTTDGANVPVKRRRTALHQSGLHGARKLVTSIFGWKGPEAEVGNDTGSHDCQRIRATDGVLASAEDSCYWNLETVSMNYLIIPMNINATNEY